MNETMKIKIANLPEKPGVYQMLDKDGNVIYVGKAKILKNRVRQYFQSQANHPIKVRKMVEHIEDLNYIITDSEVEALMLECNLIKQYRPYYNVLMKDDKSYPYLRLTTQEPYPRLELTRKRKLDKNRYYGPYTNSYAARRTMEAINRLYPTRMCSKKTAYGTKVGKVCLNYHIGQCCGCCTGEVDPARYQTYVEEIDAILSGKPEILIEKLTEEMLREADKLNFEAAGAIKEQISLVKTLFHEEQKINRTSLDERDIVAFYSDQKTACVQIFVIREGKIVTTETRYMKQTEDAGGEILSSFLKQYYTSGVYIPREILIQDEVEEQNLLEDLLSSLRGGKTGLAIPQKGDKRRLLELAMKNARLNVENKKTREESLRDSLNNALSELASLLDVKQALYRIESYDISNTGGADNVGVMVAFENGRKAPSAARRFKIKYVQGQDDYASMGEVVFRRLNRAKEEEETGAPNPKFLPLPQLILVDGGLNHVKVVKSMVETFRYPIAVAGLVKDSKHKLRGIMRDDGTEIDPRKLKYAYRLVNEISEEVHRSAIGYHKLSRSKSMLKLELENIPGIGKKRAAALLRAFGSLEEISGADAAALAAAEGMTRAAAEKVFEYFRQPEV